MQNLLRPKRLLTNQELEELIKLDPIKQKKYLEKLKEELWHTKKVK